MLSSTKGLLEKRIPVFFLFATFATTNHDRYEKIVLAMSLMGKGDSQNSKEHFDILSFVITGVFSKSMNDVGASVGDICSISRASLRSFSLRFVEGYSHRYNLAICDY